MTNLPRLIYTIQGASAAATAFPWLALFDSEPAYRTPGSQRLLHTRPKIVGSAARQLAGWSAPDVPERGCPKSFFVISTAGRNLTVVLSVIPNEVRNLDMDG